MGARVSDSSHCESGAAAAVWVCPPGLGLALHQVGFQRSDLREQTHRPLTLFLPPHLAQVHVLGRAHFPRPPAPSPLQEAGWMLSGVTSVIRSGADVHVSMHRWVYHSLGAFPRRVYNPLCQLGSPYPL